MSKYINADVISKKTQELAKSLYKAEKRVEKELEIEEKEMWKAITIFLLIVGVDKENLKLVFESMPEEYRNILEIFREEINNNDN